MSTSCEACPSFVKAADTGFVLAKPVDSDICVRFGHILSRPGVSTAASVRIRSSLAESCPAFGQDRPAIALEFPTALVSMGDPLAVALLSTRPPRTEAEEPAACNGCEFFVPPSVVKAELGWTQGMCAIKGRLIFSDRYVKEARGCRDGRIGEKRDTTDGILLLPAYDAGMASAVKVRRTTAPIDASNHRQDPRSYPTDKPTDDDDAALYIRAWRQVDDPEGVREPLFLPIFDGTKLCGFDPRTSYGQTRPDLFIDHQGLLYDLAAEMHEQGKTPILIGEAGVGKTDMATWLAWLMDLPVEMHSMRADTEVEDFIGHGTLEEKNGVTVTGYERGLFVTAFESPCVQLVDEYNVAPDSIMHFLRPAIDGRQEIVLDKAGGARCRRHPFNFLMGAQNPPWDARYIGTKVLSAADFDRITGIAVWLPPEIIERQIITERCADAGYTIEVDTLDKVMQVATDVRRQIKDGSLQIAWGVRSNIDVAIKTRYYSFEKAYRRAVLDLLEPEVADLIVASIRSVA